MKHLVTLSLLAAGLSGCALNPLSKPAAAPRPTPTARVAQVVTRPTTPAHIQASTDRAVQTYYCALIPVASEIQTASSRYDDAQNAAASQLTDSAKLDMEDAIGLLRKARAQLDAVQLPTEVARYETLLSQADNQYLLGATALRDDYAASNLPAASRDGQIFNKGGTYFKQAQQERSRVGRQVQLPDIGSPQCTQEFLRRFMAQQHASPRPTSTPAPPPTPARRFAVTHPKPAATATLKRKPAFKPKAPSRATAPGRVRAQPAAQPMPTAHPVSVAERRYIAVADRAVNRLNSATLYLSAAYQLLATKKSPNAAPLIDHAEKLLNAGTRVSAGLHPASSADSAIQQKLTSALTSNYTAVRKLRLALIDLAANNRPQAKSDLHYAHAALKSSTKESSKILDGLRAQSGAA